MTPDDQSDDMDMIPFFSETGSLAEMEALSIQGILQASDIPCILAGTSTLPVVEFVVSVPKSRLADAQRVVNEARAAGPAAAEIAERESEAAGATPD